MSYPNLFNRFLQMVTSPEWFDTLHSALTEAILTKKENDSVKVTLLFALEKWMHVRPNKVIECWKYALNTSDPAFGPILLMIDKFSHWETEGIEEILERLLEIEKGKTDDRWVGKAISKNFLENKKSLRPLWFAVFRLYSI